MIFEKLKLPFNQTLLAAQASPAKTRQSIGYIFLVYGLLSIGLSTFLINGLGMEETFGSLIANIPLAILLVWFVLSNLKYSPSSLGMNPQGFTPLYVAGSFLASFSLSLIWWISLASQGLSFSFNSERQLGLILLMLLGFICQGFLEEFLFRAVFQTFLAIRWGLPFAMLVNAGMFALAHFANPGASLISVANTVLIGMVFSLMYYYHDSIWFVAGFHSAWNFVLGPVLGVAVSGMSLPSSLLVSKLSTTQTFLTGGAYGFEAGFLVTILSLVLLLLYIFLIRKKYFSRA